ncbi:MAG TPA: hypothetical protein DCZ48_12570, partial [Methylococcaceae bacterium]|nr:hypothetical protein [Methylococcaceae bacterium]
PAPCGSDAFVAISKPLMFNIRRLIKQHRFQVYDDLCLGSLPILVYNDERKAWEREKIKIKILGKMHFFESNVRILSETSDLTAESTDVD